ncbi:hypothetical protein BH11PLA2_BH11PLA2_48350 [soil metagenome]
MISNILFPLLKRIRLTRLMVKASMLLAVVSWSFWLTLVPLTESDFHTVEGTVKTYEFLGEGRMVWLRIETLEHTVCFKVKPVQVRRDFQRIAFEKFVTPGKRITIRYEGHHDLNPRIAPGDFPDVVTIASVSDADREYCSLGYAIRSRERMRILFLFWDVSLTVFAVVIANRFRNQTQKKSLVGQLAMARQTKSDLPQI